MLLEIIEMKNTIKLSLTVLAAMEFQPVQWQLMRNVQVQIKQMLPHYLIVGITH